MVCRSHHASIQEIPPSTNRIILRSDVFRSAPLTWPVICIHIIFRQFIFISKSNKDHKHTNHVNKSAHFQSNRNRKIADKYTNPQKRCSYEGDDAGIGHGLSVGIEFLKREVNIILKKVRIFISRFFEFKNLEEEDIGHNGRKEKRKNPEGAINQVKKPSPTQSYQPRSQAQNIKSARVFKKVYEKIHESASLYLFLIIQQTIPHNRVNQKEKEKT